MKRCFVFDRNEAKHVGEISFIKQAVRLAASVAALSHRWGDLTVPAPPAIVYFGTALFEVMTGVTLRPRSWKKRWSW